MLIVTHSAFARSSLCTLQILPSVPVQSRAFQRSEMLCRR